MWKRIWGANLAKKADRLGTYASALAYCFVLSVVPFMVVSFAVASQLVGTQDVTIYQATLQSVLPVESEKAVAHIIEAVETSSHNVFLKTIGLIFAAYASFNLMNQIVRTLLFIFDDSRRPYEWTWKVFIKTISLLAIWTFLMLLLTGCAVFSVLIHNSALQASTHMLMRPWRVASDLFMVFSLFVAFFATYYLVPSKRYSLRLVRDGALVASIGWVGCSMIFLLLTTNHLLSVNMVYRALGSVVIVLFWAQACAWSVIAGACWMVRASSRR